MTISQEDKDAIAAGQKAGMKGKVGVSFTLNFRDKDGNVVQRMDFTGSVPTDQLISEQGNGTDDR